MKRKLIAGVVAMVSMACWGGEIDFQKGKFEEALKLADEKGKLLFVDVYTDWCGPCKTMAKNVFTDDAVADFYNANFVNFKLNAEDGEGNRIALADRYEVTGYPTLLYLEGSGEVRSRAVGGMSSESFIAQGEAAIKGDRLYEELMARYQQGESDQPFMEKFLLAAIGKLSALGRAGDHDKTNAFGDKMVSIAERYFEALPKNKWPTKANVTILSRLISVRGLEHPINRYVYNHPHDFYDVDDATLFGYLSNFHLTRMLEMAGAGDLTYRDLLEDVRLQRHFREDFDRSWGKGVDVEQPGYRVMKAYAEIGYAGSQKDWSTFIDGIDEMVALRGESFLSSPDFSGMATEIMRGKCRDNSVLNRLDKYAVKLYKAQPVYNYQSGMVHAEILAVQGSKDEALSIIESMALSFKEFGENGEKYIKHLDRLKRRIERMK